MRAARLRRPALIVAAGVVVVVAVGLVATHIDRRASVDPQAPVAAAASDSVVQTPATIPTGLPTPTPSPAPVTPTPSTPATTPSTTPRPTTPRPATTRPTTTPPGPVPVGGVLPANRSVVLHGDAGEQMTLAVVRVTNPAPTVDPDHPKTSPKLGRRLVSVIVRVANSGDVPFLDDVEKYTWLVDKAGHTYPRNIGMTDARQLHPAARLDPGWLDSREIVFEVPGRIEITRFRLSRHPGLAPQTQDWRLA